MSFSSVFKSFIAASVSLLFLIYSPGGKTCECLEHPVKMIRRYTRLRAKFIQAYGAVDILFDEAEGGIYRREIRGISHLITCRIFLPVNRGRTVT